MLETKDPAIKLFGKTIPLPDIPAAAAGGDPPSSSSDLAVDDSPSQDRPSSPNSSPENDDLNIVGEEQALEKDPARGRLTDTKQEDGDQTMTSEETGDPNVTSLTNEDPKSLSVENDAEQSKAPKTEEEQGDTSNQEEKTLKKPDKILPCPRCNSMDTKFCYYNNYNVNQPRHFCKNCQRYWTAGGTMRNVPVGAGRRKNKNLAASHYRHITVSEALQNVRTDLPNGISHHPTVTPNGTVLTFGSDIPLCESMASVLNINEKTINGFRRPEALKIPVSSGDGENGDDRSSGSSVNASNSKDEVGKNGFFDPVMRSFHSFPPQVPCFPGAPWPYPWNSAQWSPPVPPPGLCPPGFSMPFYPGAPYWGCSVPSAWNVWVPPPTFSPSQTSPSSGPISPTLGKHSREDENLPKPINSGEEKPQELSNHEKCLWVPKTLRIKDPEEAAKSSIWATLGIKNDKVDLISKEGLFQAFQSKGDEKNHVSETSPVLQANPAALSRSLNFHERS